MLTADSVQAALGDIYDTALDAQAWPAALNRLRGLFRCHFADAFQRTVDYSAWRGVQVGLDERDYQDVFLGYWVTNNVWGQRRPTRRSGDIVMTREMMTDAELQRSDMYSEYLRPRQLEEGLRLDIWADASGVEDISLLRPWSAGSYTRQELRAASALIPHLQRASVIRRRLADAKGLADAGLASLEHVRMAVLLLGPQGRVMHANRAAEALLRAGDPVQAGPDGLSATTAGSTRALKRLIHAATGSERSGSRVGDRGGDWGGDWGAPQSGSVRLPCASGRPAVLAVAMPVRPGQHDPFGITRPAAFLCLIDRTLHHAPSPQHLVTLFGLTLSEAALANDLLSGREVQDIARRTGRSIHTVRSLLSRLMAKTETSRQAELVRLLGLMPHQ